jgi:dTDP-4-dehydrorhamnose reductase
LKILLTGASGQLGNELYPLLSQRGDVVPVDVNTAGSNAPDCVQADLGDGPKLQSLLDENEPKLIVNAAAYTAVDRAEEEPDLAALVNETLPQRLAEWAQRHDSAVIHYSTDYVFDGSARRPYREDDSPAPLNVYGATKLGGENVLRASGCHSLTLRTSWVYSSHGHNFVLSMLRLAATHPMLRIVDDQVGCPTSARNLAQATLACLDRNLVFSSKGARLLHYSDASVVSWHGFAAEIFAIATRLGLVEQTPELEAIDTAAYPQAATRPRYSVLDTRALREATGFQPPSLAESLEYCLKEVAHHE